MSLKGGFEPKFLDRVKSLIIESSSEKEAEEVIRILKKRFSHWREFRGILFSIRVWATKLTRIALIEFPRLILVEFLRPTLEMILQAKPATLAVILIFGFLFLSYVVNVVPKIELEQVAEIKALLSEIAEIRELIQEISE